MWNSSIYSSNLQNLQTALRKLCTHFVHVSLTLDSFSLIVCHTFSVIFVSEDCAGQVIPGIFLVSFHSRVKVEPRVGTISL